MAYESYESFEAVKSRLDEIVDAVNDKSLPLDQALSLYEEAVGLGLRASDLLEQGIDAASAEQVLADQAASSEDGAPSDDALKQRSADADAAEQGKPSDSARVSGGPAA